MMRKDIEQKNEYWGIIKKQVHSKSSTSIDSTQHSLEGLRIPSLPLHPGQSPWAQAQGPTLIIPSLHFPGRVLD